MRSKYGGSPSLGVGYSITLFGVGWESPPNMFYYMYAGRFYFSFLEEMKNGDG